MTDVQATVEWYRAIGFSVLDTWREAEEDGGELTWAELSFGNGTVSGSTFGQLASRTTDVTG